MHVDVDRAGLAGIVVAPDLLEELVPADDLARMSEEEREELEDLRLHRNLGAVPEHAVPGEVDGDIPEVDRRRTRRAGRLAATKDRANARRQLAGAERLRHVVIGAELQPDHLVDLRITRRE